LYGRFVGKWFSKSGWTADKRRVQGMSSEENLQNPKDQLSDKSDNENGTENIATELALDRKAEINEGSNKQEEAQKADLDDNLAQKDAGISTSPIDQKSVALLPKILRTTKLYFGSKSFYFSYDIDISRRLSMQVSSKSQPLFQQFDPLVCLTTSIFNHGN
jgi:hypothetical protein